ICQEVCPVNIVTEKRLGLRQMSSTQLPPSSTVEARFIAPQGNEPLRGGFFEEEEQARRGGSGADVVWGPLWPPVGVEGPTSTRHGGQPQGPPHRPTLPLPLREQFQPR